MGDRLTVDVRFLPPGGVERIYVLRGPAASVALDPSWQRAFWVFVKSGVGHILEGYDHLLFLLCMVMPFRRLSWSLVGIITSFTVAHTITLFAAAFNLVPAGRWFPPLVEVLIALSIIYMAIENLIVPNLDRRWLITGIFGLVHGLGFSFALRDELKFAGDHLVLSLVAFNAGIEIGQFIVLALLLPMLALIARWPLCRALHARYRCDWRRRHRLVLVVRACCRACNRCVLGEHGRILCRRRSCAGLSPYYRRCRLLADRPSCATTPAILARGSASSRGYLALKRTERTGSKSDRRRGRPELIEDRSKSSGLQNLAQIVREHVGPLRKPGIDSQAPLRIEDERAGE